MIFSTVFSVWTRNRHRGPGGEVHVAEIAKAAVYGGDGGRGQ